MSQTETESEHDNNEDENDEDEIYRNVLSKSLMQNQTDKNFNSSITTL